jgi:transcriptional regulator with XRE-family HTH domain
MAITNQKSDPLVSITDAQRQEIKNARLALGLEQKQLAAKARVSNGTMSNVEGGRSKQVRRSVLLRIFKALRLGEVPKSDAALVSEVVDLLSQLNAADLITVRDLAASLVNRSTKPA